MIVESLSSGSSGNALLLRSGAATILVDCGLGPRPLRALLHQRGVALEGITAVLLTHEHDDHVRGLVGLKSASGRIHGTPGTLRALGLSGDRVCALEPLRPHLVNELEITPIPTSHDAADPCGYSITDGTARITILTDLGCYDEGHVRWIGESNLVVIEANHDLHMLRSGPYPAHLKRRVQSHLGHLSNAECGVALAGALADARFARTIWLAHLSATNNRPELAVSTVRSALGANAGAHNVIALPRRTCGPVWDACVPPPAIASQLALTGI